MSFYNLIFGVNPLAGALLAALDLTPDRVPRFRDCYWTGTHIAIYTRTGGGNRDYYESAESCRENYPERFNGNDNPRGPWNADLRTLPGFSHDEDDDFDSTYATFYFTPSPPLRDALAAAPAADATPEQRWEAFLDKLRSGTDDAQVQRVVTAMQPLMEAIAKGERP